MGESVVDKTLSEGSCWRVLNGQSDTPKMVGTEGQKAGNGEARIIDPRDTSSPCGRRLEEQPHSHMNIVVFLVIDHGQFSCCTRTR